MSHDFGGVQGDRATERPPGRTASRPALRRAGAAARPRAACPLPSGPGGITSPRGEHGVDAGRHLLRRRERRAVDDRRRVEYDEVSRHPRGDLPAIADAEPGGYWLVACAPPPRATATRSSRTYCPSSRG